MEASEGWALVILGAFLLTGYVAYVIGPRIFVPRVTLLLIIGALCGPSILDLVPKQVSNWFPFVAHMALAMVGFLLGESFVQKELKEKGRVILWISIGETVLTASIVFGALVTIGAPIVLALILAGIAPASAPAAIFETIREGKAKGPLTDTVLGVVAIDDAWGVMAFSLLFVAAQAVAGQGAASSELLNGLWQIFGAILVGGVIGLPMAWLTGRIKQGEPTLVEAVGCVFLCSGVATVLNVSYLLAAMVLGAVVANLAKHHARPFHAIEGISEPFFAVFFLLAGFRFELKTLATLGLIGGVYVAARAIGLVVGGAIAGKVVEAPSEVRKRVGWCILPQAGVALGFALLAQEKLPGIGDRVLPLVIATTVLFEIAGPLIARWQLYRAGEIGELSGKAA